MKRYVRESGSDDVRTAMQADSEWFVCRIGFVEVIRAVHVAGYPSAERRLRAEWPRLNVIDVDQVLADRAATLARSKTLRSLDALHLAAALLLQPDDLTVLTWDRRLHAAAREHGLTVSPDALD